MNKSSLVFGVLVSALILAVADLMLPSVRVLMMIFLGVLLAILLHGMSNRVARLSNSNYGGSVAIVVSILALLLCGGSYFLGQQLIQSAATLSSELQSAAEEFETSIQNNKNLKDLIPSRDELQKQVSKSVGGLSFLLETTRVISGFAGALLLISFVGLYLAFDPGLYKEGLVKLVPLEQRDRAHEVLNHLHSALTHWIVGQLMSMTIVGVCTAVGLWILGVPHPLTLGVLAGFIAFIPNFGPVIAAIPQLLLAIKVGSDTVLYVLIFNLVLQAVESYVLTPLIQKHQVTIPPALTIVAQLLFGVMLGVIGVITAAPIVVTGMVLIQMLYIEDYLNDDNPGELAEG